jgi:hypothetical protein
VTLGESQRAEYERRFIEVERRREERRRTRDASPPETASANAASDGTNPLLSLAHEPQFVSRAYFLRFKFEPTRYALVGREQLDGRTVLRVEYYPSRLFRDSDEEDAGGAGSGSQEPDQDKDGARINRQMNKVALVTMWVLQDTHQIVRYTFDNIGFDFLPGRSVVRLDDVRATMQMGEMFPGVWLPRSVEARVAVTLANGTFRMDYDLAYMNYRQAEVKARVR